METHSRHLTQLIVAKSDAAYFEATVTCLQKESGIKLGDIHA